MGDNIALFIGFVITIALIAVVITFPLMWCWNYVMPDLFGLAEINFWQALVLSLLSSMLFKSPNSSKG